MKPLRNVDIKYIKGVGEARASMLASELGVHTVRDMLYTFPFRYVDRSKFYKISDMHGEMPAVQILGRFVRFETAGEGARKRLIGLFSDGRSLIEVIWFARIKQISESYAVGRDYVIFGKPNFFRGNYSMVHPEIEPYNPEKPQGGFRGIYSLTEKMRKRSVTMKWMQSVVGNILQSGYGTAMSETLPAEIVERLHLMPIREAMRNMHFPESAEKLQKARERFKFEELFYIELNILRFSMQRSRKIRGEVFSKIGEKFNSFFFNVLPFELTGAQKRVLREIRADMGSGRQMNRLLQGDVGCGKTLVAFMTMLMAIDNGYQATIMAPTEILATQHFESLSQWAKAVGVTIDLLTGSTPKKKRREIDECLRDGSLNILVGTHALLEDNVEYRRLGVAVIDEQHRFGVAQRARLWRKGVTPPHVLVMTATPIPRTLAMTVYGDLDVSVIDELPPGRKPVQTLLRFEDGRRQVDSLVFSQLKQGRQVYIVYPLIHENDKLELKSLEADIEYLREKFSSYRLAYVHGQMKPAEKDHQMQLFVSGEAHIMVATTVIEVGVNVPNATVMIIENAERFGLSQLHQLRGRVGRGADKSYCILMSKQKIAAETRKRLTIMTETTDGFLISEADLKMRGPGDMEGTQQSGIAFNLKLTNLATDGQLISLARDTARSVLESNPQLRAETGEAAGSLALSGTSLLLVRTEMAVRFDKTVNWSLIS